MLIGHTVSDANGMLLTVDRAIGDLLHRTPAELVGMAYTELTHPDDLAANVRQISTLEVGAPTLSIRKRYLRPDGSSVLCNVQVSRFSVGEAMGRLVGTIYTVEPNETAVMPEHLLSAALHLQQAMLLRQATLGPELFADHAWFLLLEIWLAEARGALVQSAALAAIVGTTERVARRWLHVLVEKGFVDRAEDHGGAVQLTAMGIHRVEQLLTLQDATRLR